MTSDLFYALIKLVTGEELLAKVCAFIENNEVLVVLDNPILVTLVPPFRGNAPMVKVNPWVSLSSETTHIIRRKDIVTMSEVKDKSLAEIHDRYVRQMNSDFSSSSLLSGNSQIIKIKDARKALEDLYNQESHSNFE